MKKGLYSGATTVENTPSPPQSSHPKKSHNPSQVHHSQDAHDKQMVKKPDETAPIEILRMRPSNKAARQGMHALLQLQQKGELDPHHSAFVKNDGLEYLDPENGSIERGSDETTDEESRSQDDPIVQVGYFTLDLQSPAISLDKFTIGRGSQKFGPKRDVDIMLVAPRSQQSTRSLGKTHVILTMHEHSGAWILKAVESFRLKGESVPKGAQIALCDHRSLLGIGSFEYWVEFQIDTSEKEASYISRRNERIVGSGMGRQLPEISGIPFTQNITLQTAVFRQGLNSGTFACVFQGFDPKNGELRAIKRLSIKRKSQHLEIDQEIRALRELSGTIGIVQVLEYSSSQGNEWSREHCPLDIYIVMEKGVTFDHFKWANYSDWERRRFSFGQLLQGLEAIHKKGWIHRDINPSNILFYPLSGRAVIFDFGKVNFGLSSTDTVIAAWIYLPPEIQPDVGYVYGQKIDVWMLGFALIRSWFDYDQKISQRSPYGYGKILQNATAQMQKAPPAIGQTLQGMVAWNSKDRPTASRCYQSLEPQSDSPGVKKARTEI